MCFQSMAVALTVVALCGDVRADEHDMDGFKLYPLQAIEWKDGPASLPKGAKIAVLEGDPNKEGPFCNSCKASRRILHSTSHTSTESATGAPH